MKIHRPFPWPLQICYIWQIPQLLWLHDEIYSNRNWTCSSNLVNNNRCWNTKNAGKISIDNMALIQLMHPEFQINNKLVRKRVLENAEIWNKVTNKQHRSRKHNQAGLLALNKCLIGYIWRILRMLACYEMNDAIGCFDRIDHTPTIITLIHFDFAYNSAHTLFQFIQKSLSCIKNGYTGYDISGPVYGYKSVLLAGCGQENGLEPTPWALISTDIFIVCKRASHGMKFFISITKLLICFMGYLFIDNSNIFQGFDNVNTSSKVLIPEFQELMKRWNGGIRASGGAVCPKKTKWFLIDYK